MRRACGVARHVSCSRAGAAPLSGRVGALWRASQGDGIITSSPAGIDYGSFPTDTRQRMDADFPTGSTVTVTMTADVSCTLTLRASSP